MVSVLKKENLFKDQIIFRSRDGPKKNINWPLIYSFSPQNSAIKQTLPEKSQKNTNS